MSIFGTIGDITVPSNIRPVMSLIKKDEVYDKKKKVLTGEELFDLCYKRYKLSQRVFLPLQKALSTKYDVTNIRIETGLQDDLVIVVEYKNNEKNLSFTIARIDNSLIDVYQTYDKSPLDTVMQNKDVVLKTFDNIINKAYDRDYIVLSTSKNFSICFNCENFIITDVLQKGFSLQMDYSFYEKNKTLYDPKRIICSYKKLKELLLDENNYLNIYRHLHVYEDSVEKTLIKKM